MEASFTREKAGATSDKQTTRNGAVRRVAGAIGIGAGLLLLTGCRGDIDEKAPIDEVASATEAYGWEPQIVGDRVYVSCDNGTTYVANLEEGNTLRITDGRLDDEHLSGAQASKNLVCDPEQ
jgi:hypothetical protein